MFVRQSVRRGKSAGLVGVVGVGEKVGVVEMVRLVEMVSVEIMSVTG
jgi:hypothetical protein